MKSLVLIHHPVYDRRGDKQASSVTPFDIHDLSRSCRTFGVDRFYITHPAPLQRGIVERILGFWNVGGGKSWNLHRSDALNVCRIVPDLTHALNDIINSCSENVTIIGTTAKQSENAISYSNLRSMAFPNIVILLGTGWGLTNETFDICDYILNPILGAGDFNHLSVRAAGAIILDRIYGERDENK